MREDFSYHVKRISDRRHCEIHPREIYDIFMRDYVNVSSPLSVPESHFKQTPEGIIASCTIVYMGRSQVVEACWERAA